MVVDNHSDLKGNCNIMRMKHYNPLKLKKKKEKLKQTNKHTSCSLTLIPSNRTTGYKPAPLNQWHPYFSTHASDRAG